MSEIDKLSHMDGPGIVLNWYGFICPFCYVGLHRNAILARPEPRRGARNMELKARRPGCWTND